MATAIKYRHGSTSQHMDFTGGLEAEITVDVDKHTLYVHNGDGRIGTPLARADLNNVDAENIKSKGILDSYLTNFGGGNYTDIVDGKNHQLGIQLANYLDLISILSLDTDFADIHLSNVSKNDLKTLAGDDTFITYNLSNIRTSILAGETPGLIGTEKPLAYKDMSNINTEYLAVSDQTHTHQGKNLAYEDLSNLNISVSDLPTLNTKGLQTTDKLINVTTATSSDTDKYPTAASVKSEITRLDNTPKITDIRVSDVNTGTIRVKVSTANISLNIHYLFSDTNISGAWSQDQSDPTIKIFTPLSATDVTDNGWVITIN